LLCYFSTSKFNKLKYQSIDSTFVTNLFGGEIYGRNVKYKSKNGVKISTISDSNGIPVSIALAAGNKNDALILQTQINNELIETESNRVANNKRYKQTIFGDAAYDNESLREAFMKRHQKLVTDVNIRNTKKREKIAALQKRKKEYLPAEAGSRFRPAQAGSHFHGTGQKTKETVTD
jgi:hypothetical protein